MTQVDSRGKKSLWMGKRGHFAVFGGILVHLSLGSIYTFGNMLPYIASYMASSNGNDAAAYDYYSGQCSYIFAFTLAAQGIIFPFGGKLGDIIGIRLSILVGSWFMALGVGLSYFSVSNLVAMFFTYGIMFGAGIGIAYPNILVCVMKWFPNHKGFVNGCVLAGFGISASIWNEVQTSFINPNNVSQNTQTGFLYFDNVLNRIPYCFVLMACSFAVMQILGFMLLAMPSEINRSEMNGINIMIDEETPLMNEENEEKEKSGLKDGAPTIFQSGLSEVGRDNNNSSSSQTDNIENNGENGTSSNINDIRGVLSSFQFWHLYVTFLLNGVIIIFISTQWKYFNNEYLGITNDSFLSAIGSCASVFNGFGRIFWGTIYDRVGYFNITMGLISGLLTIFLFTWPLLSNVSTNVLPLLWICILFGLFSGNFAVFPTIITECFGAKNNGINIGLIFTSLVVSSFVGIYALVVVKQWLDSWRYLCWFMAVIQLFSMIVSVAFRHKRKMHMQRKL